jgi:hypothetical protein
MPARTKPKRLLHLLMSGSDAEKPENLIKMFEAIKPLRRRRRNSSA